MVNKFLKQWWKVKSITKLNGDSFDLRDYIYHNHPFVYGFHLRIRTPQIYQFCFSYFDINEKQKTLCEYGWHTSDVENIEERDDMLIVTTQNSIYTFEKTDENPLNVFNWGESIIPGFWS